MDGREVFYPSYSAVDQTKPGARRSRWGSEAARLGD